MEFMTGGHVLNRGGDMMGMGQNQLGGGMLG